MSTASLYDTCSTVSFFSEFFICDRQKLDVCDWMVIITAVFWVNPLLAYFALTSSFESTDLY